uniref:Uncharacterized protein n=2 Tax=Brassica TaxID=3705 RepID=A0A3P6D935_BRACM|nr:unnamed protein product [Brassica rapa]
MFLPMIPGATFVVFDGEMTKLTKQHGTALALEEINGGGGGNYQDVLKSLLARSTFFRAVDNSFLDPHSESCFINQTPVIEVEGRQPTTSVSNTVAAAKIEIGGDESSPPGFEGKEKSCKRPEDDQYLI